MLSTVAAPRRQRRRRRGRRVSEQADPAPVPSARATLAQAASFENEQAAADWLETLRGDRTAREAQVEDAARVLNRVLRAHRAAAADPYAREVRAEQALARRVGYGWGVAVAEGRLDESVEVPHRRARRRRAERLSPQERLAATLGGRRELLACEELVLRARLDLDAERGREAALQARIALEALLAELRSSSALRGEAAGLEADRERLASAANAALDGEIDDTRVEAVAAAVERMERALARDRPTPR